MQNRYRSTDANRFAEYVTLVKSTISDSTAKLLVLLNRLDEAKKSEEESMRVHHDEWWAFCQLEKDENGVRIAPAETDDTLAGIVAEVA